MNGEQFGAEDDEVLVRLPEIILGVTPDGKHLAIQFTMFVEPEYAIRLAHGLEDTALAMQDGYKGAPVAEPSTD